MARQIRDRVIYRIAVRNRVSLDEAKRIYKSRPDSWKHRACAEESRRQD
jgi:hypothetical protein